MTREDEDYARRLAEGFGMLLASRPDEADPDYDGDEEEEEDDAYSER